MSRERWWAVGGTCGEKSWLIAPAGGSLPFQEILGEELLLPKERHPDWPSGASQGVPLPVGGLEPAMRLDMVGLGVADGDGAAPEQPPPLFL